MLQLTYAGFLTLLLGSQTAVAASKQEAGVGIGQAKNNKAMTFNEAIKSAIANIKTFYMASNPYNHTHKNIKDWKNDDLKKVSDGDIDLIRTMTQNEQYPITDTILPKGMNRQDFYRAILRESARRGNISNDYVDALLEPDLHSKEVSLVRTSYGTEKPISAQVRALAGVVAIRDAEVDMIVNSPDHFRIQKDYAAALGVSAGRGLPLLTDVRTYDFGYTAGAMPQYRNNDALNITATSPLPPSELQEKYCPVVENIFKVGTAYINSDNFRTGFLQARIDARTNFEPVTEHVGLFAECR